MFIFKSITKACCLITLSLFSTMISAQTYPFSFEEIQKSPPVTDYQELDFQNKDGQKIHYYTFTPDTPIARLIFIHGGGASSEMGYFNLAQQLRDQFGIQTILMDLVGHGKSEGRRGDCSSVESVYEDIRNLSELLPHDELPIYLGGHSSGAGLVLNFSSWDTDSIFDGFVFVAPEFGHKSKTARENRVDFAEVSTFKFILNAFSGGQLAAHNYAVDLQYPPQIITLFPQTVTRLTVNMAKALTPSQPQKQFEGINIPTAIFIGEEDELFEPSQVIAYHELSDSINKQSVAEIIPEVNHLSILLHVSDPIGTTILRWINGT